MVSSGVYDVYSCLPSPHPECPKHRPAFRVLSAPDGLCTSEGAGVSQDVGAWTVGNERVIELLLVVSASILETWYLVRLSPCF